MRCFLLSTPAETSGSSALQGGGGGENRCARQQEGNEVKAPPLLTEDPSVGKQLRCVEPRLSSGLNIGSRIIHTRLLYKLFILFLQRM